MGAGRGAVGGARGRGRGGAALSTDRRLPSGLDALVRETCSSLDFPPSAVRVMRSGGRLVTAALVGPLPWPRYLLLTDGLLAVLDPFALRGVVAHEVGHARARHPGLLLLLFVVVPVLAIHPLTSIDLEALAPESLALGGLVGLGCAWWLVRRVMHQMEFEADHLSAEALGGAMPTITALERVGDVHGARGDRATFRHPSGRARIQALLAWERDPGYRDRFARRSRRLRRAIAVVLVTAVTLNAWSMWRTWDVDRIYLAFLTGDIAQATERLEALPDDAPGFADRERTELAETLSAARELVDGGGPWESIGPELARDAWRRGLDELARSGPVQASRWFDLATLGPTPGITRQLTQRWSRAARDGEQDEEARVARHLAGLPDLPPELRAALEEQRAGER
ncbi:MAG: M48 family metalloprotease [Planctomycetes bacterium]|nr:M48 family metalloprotease [Planctomycetota bacterium]